MNWPFNSSSPWARAFSRSASSNLFFAFRANRYRVMWSEVWKGASMLMAVLLGAEMPLRLHGLAALWADRPPVGDHLLPPAGHGARLAARAPETDHRGLIRLIVIGQDLAQDEYHQVALLIVPQADFA